MKQLRGDVEEKKLFEQQTKVSWKDARAKQDSAEMDSSCDGVFGGLLKVLLIDNLLFNITLTSARLVRFLA